MITIKQFFSYLIFRIFKKGGYFYMITFVSFPICMICVFYIEQISWFDNILDNKPRSIKIVIYSFFFIPIWYLFSLLIPFSYVKNLNFNPEERKKYRNIFLILLALFLSLLAYDLSKNWVSIPLDK